MEATMQDIYLTIPSSDSHRKPVDADTYWNMLKNLSSEIKLELISKLSASLLVKKAPLENARWASDFAGKWQDDCSAEDIVADIRQARTINREIEL